MCVCVVGGGGGGRGGNQQYERRQRSLVLQANNRATKVITVLALCVLGAAVTSDFLTQSLEAFSCSYCCAEPGLAWSAIKPCVLFWSATEPSAPAPGDDASPSASPQAAAPAAAMKTFLLSHLCALITVDRPFALMHLLQSLLLLFLLLLLTGFRGMLAAWSG